MNVITLINRLETLGFYTLGAGKSYNGFVAAHDAFDHLLYPRGGACPHANFIPPNPEGEVWASANEWAKKLLYWEQYGGGDEDCFEDWWIEGTLRGSLMAMRYQDPSISITEGKMYAFYLECKHYWSLPENQENLKEYYALNFNK